MSSNEEESMSEHEMEMDDAFEQCELAIKSTKDNPNDYDAHLNCLAVLKKYPAMANELRKAREWFADHFPLTEELWLDWLSDEIAIAETTEDEADRERVELIYERAVKDYFNMTLWHGYVQYVLIRAEEGDSKYSTADSIRQVFDKVLKIVGNHPTEAGKVWQTYREYEQQILSSLESPGDIKSQQDRMCELYIRQLSIPLQDNAQVLSEFKAWSEYNSNSQQDFPTITKTNEIHMKEVQQLLAFETKSPIPWKEYVEYCIAERKQRLLPLIFERAIAATCLSPEFWTQYLDYLNFTAQDIATAMDVCKRSLRNITWSGDLWQFHLLLCEKLELPLELNVFEAKLATGDDYLKLFLAYCNYCRRKLSTEELVDACAQAALHLKTNFPDRPDLYLSLQHFAIECTEFPSEPKTTIQKGLLKEFGQFCNVWLVQINALSGDARRPLYREAIKQVEDYPDLIRQSWIEFETQHGTLDTYFEARASELKASSKRKQPVEANQSTPQKRIKKAVPEKKKKKGVVEKKQRVPEKKVPALKVFISGLADKTTDESLKEFFKPCGNIKASRLVSTQRGDGRRFGFVEFFNTDAVKAAIELNGKELDGVGISVAMARAELASKEGVWKTHPTTLHVAGFDKIKKQQLWDEFKKLGKVLEVHLPVTKHGKLKGYALIEFAKKETLDKALDVSFQIDDQQLECHRSRFSAKEMERQARDRKNEKKQFQPKPTGRHPRLNMKPRTVVAKEAVETTTTVPLKSNADFRALLMKS